jgi:hypothetical protein
LVLCTLYFVLGAWYLVLRFGSEHEPSGKH